MWVGKFCKVIHHSNISSMGKCTRFFFFFCLVFVAARDFSRGGEWGLLSGSGSWTSHCSGFSSCGALALGHMGTVGGTAA